MILIAQGLGGTPSVDLADKGETEWSFGQLLTLMLLILPFVSALELLRGMDGFVMSQDFANNWQDKWQFLGRMRNATLTKCH